MPRAGSATARLLALLPEAPVVTARTVERVLGVSYPAANTAVQELADAGVLRARQLGRGTTGYLATEVLGLVDLTERRLASTAFDTRTRNPMRRAGRMPELANLAVYLLSSGSDYVNGQTIAIDGAEYQATGGNFSHLSAWTPEDWNEAASSIQQRDAADRRQRAA